MGVCIAKRSHFVKVGGCSAPVRWQSAAGYFKPLLSMMLGATMEWLGG